MIRNRFFALLTALCLLVSTVPIHSHASQTDSLDTLYHSRHHRDATRQVQTDSRGQRLISQSTQSVLPARDNEFLVSNILDGNCQWGIADDGFLYIWCDGEMPHREADQYPWSAYKSLYTKLYVGSGTVADNAFANCDNLQMVLLEEDVTAIGQNAFANCMALEEFWFYGAAPTIAENAFSGTQTLLISHYDDDSFASITGKNFGGNLSWVTWIEAVDGGMYGTVEWTVFEDMSMQLNGTGSSMQSQASAENYPWYSWSTHITYLSCESISQLGNYAFADFTALEYAEFDQSLAAIGSKTFYNCDGITLVFVGDAPSLGEEAFCSSDLYLEYPEDNPTWTDAAVMLFFGIVLDENELPLDWPTTEGPSNELPLDKPSDVSPPDKPIPPADTPQGVTCAITAQQVYNAMIALQPQYPEGMHWTNDDYYAWNGGYFTGGYGCAGFAFILSDAAFGTEPCRLIEENITIDDIRVGDILRINNDTHSVIVLEVHADHVVIAEGNFNSSIHWGRTLSAQTVADVTNYIMTRYPEHSWRSGSCLDPQCCWICGYTAEAPGHSWLDASCTAPKTCLRCGFTEGEALGHVYDNDADSECNLCGFQRDTGAQSEMPLSDLELEVLRLTNLERAANNLKPLTATVLLQQATDIRAVELHTLFDHARPNGTQCFTVLNELGIPYWSAAENIALGYSSAAEVVNAWMNSTGHRANILNAGLGHMGVGAHTEYRTSWVQLFTDAPQYTAIRVDVPEETAVPAGTSIDDMGLVAVLRNSSGNCWLPLADAYCSGYDPAAAGLQTVTVSVLGVTCTFQITVLGEDHVHTWQDATCDAPKTCLECGETEGEPLSHQWLPATCKAPKTCSLCGMTNGFAWGHNWQSATCLTPATCSRCGETTGQASGHKWAEATCEAPKTCLYCGETEGSPLDHDWTAASCAAPKTCSLCGETEGEALPHNWLEATCEAPKTCFLCRETEGEALGHDWDTASCSAPSTCGRCGLTSSTPIGHQWQEATCVSPKTCPLCGETEGEPLPHDWLEATCEAPKTCFLCGETEGEVLGHDWQEATCDAPKTCAFCAAEEGEPLGHDWPELTCAGPTQCRRCGLVSSATLNHTWLEATCETIKTCSVCGKTEGEPLGHLWGPGYVFQAPTATSAGIKRYDCSRCQATRSEELSNDLYPFTPVGEKDRGFGAVTVRNPQDNAEQALTYPIAQDGATVLIFFSAYCGRSAAMMKALNDCDWIASPYLNLVAVECVSGTGKAVLSFRDTYTPDAVGYIDYRFTDNPQIPFHYFRYISSADTLTWPLVMVVTDSEEGPQVSCGISALTDISHLQTVLTSVSPAFAQWVTPPHTHTWLEATCEAPKTCTACGTTEGKPLEHLWQDATCQMPKFCPRCSATEGTPAPHDFRDGCCTVCLLPERMIGDANGDGKITYDDALKVLRASISLDTLPADVMQACDVDGSGRLDYNDALLILRYSIKLITEFPQKK